MKGTVLAHVRRVLTSNEGRALVHAVEDDGREHKIELPIEAVRGVSLDEDHVLQFTWSLEARPRPAESSTPRAEPSPPAATAVRPSPSAVDQAFMELMARLRGTTPAAAPAVAPTPSVSSDAPASARSTSQGLAELLGIKRSHDPR